MKGRMPSMKPAEVIKILERNGFRLLRSTKHRTYTDDASPPHLVRVPYHNRDLKQGTRRKTGYVNAAVALQAEQRA